MNQHTKLGEPNGPRLAGLSGPFAAGKDLCGNHLRDNRGFMHVSQSGILRIEATKRGLSHERYVLGELAAQMRREVDDIGALIYVGIGMWEEQADDYPGGLAISGLRVVGESYKLKDRRGKLIYVDAPADFRYEWARQRAIEEGRIVDIQGINSVEEFVESERYEMEGLGGPGKIHLRGVAEIADVVIQNTGTKAELTTQLDKALGLVA